MGDKLTAEDAEGRRGMDVHPPWVHALDNSRFEQSLDQEKTTQVAHRQMSRVLLF
jgi:hypothetical protein